VNKMKVKKICKQCGREFEVERYREKIAKYCSRKCSGLAHAGSIIKLKCINCNKEFKVKMHKIKSKKHYKFCSRDCFYQYNRGAKNNSWKGGKIEINCANCGKKLKRWPFELKRKHSFCDMKCQCNYYRNHPEELKNNDGQFRKGLHYSSKTEFKKGLRYSPETEFKKNEPPWNKGTESTSEMKKHLKELSAGNWHNDKYLFNTFRGQMFGKNYKLNELDKEIIRTRIRLFKIHKKGGETHETGRL